MKLSTFLVVIVLAAAGGLTLTAVLPDAEPSVIELNTVTSAEASYTTRVRAHTAVAGLSDAALVRVGRGLCDAIAQTPHRVVAPVPLEGLTAEQTRAIVDAATLHLCPALRGKVSDYLRDGIR